MTASPHQSTSELADRLGANAQVCTAVSSSALSPSLREVVLAGAAQRLAGAPGNDVMIRVAQGPTSFVRRRYSVRELDPELDRFTLWISTEHDGPGSRWAERVNPGDPVDVVGPRGKILLDTDADWHLFMGDVSGLGAFYRMAQSIEPPGQAIFITEIDRDEDALTATFDERVGVTGIFVNRQARRYDDPAGLLSGLAAFALPPDSGHAYLFGEFSIIRTLRVALADRGLTDDQVSFKSFWRMGRMNADHGEPDKSDD